MLWDPLRRPPGRHTCKVSFDIEEDQWSYAGISQSAGSTVAARKAHNTGQESANNESHDEN